MVSTKYFQNIATGKTYNAVWNRTKKIQEILGSDKNIKDIIKKELKY